MVREEFEDVYSYRGDGVKDCAVAGAGFGDCRGFSGFDREEEVQDAGRDEGDEEGAVVYDDVLHIY